MDWHSLVHENGKASTEASLDGVEVNLSYAHTHVAFCAKTKMGFRSQKKFDFQGAHPNIKNVLSDLHAKRLWEYHQKAPVLLLQSPNGPLKDKDYYTRILAAPSLIEAIKVAGVEVKSIADVHLLRTAKGSLQTLPVFENAYFWRFELTPGFRTVFLSGPTGIGKTQWALSQFSCPLLVSIMEDLKQFSPELHDGIVFDDTCLSTLPPHMLIHLTDWDLPRTINVKYGSITIPAHTRKIITSNQTLECSVKDVSPEHLSAIKRRCQMISESTRLYIVPKAISDLDHVELDDGIALDNEMYNLFGIE